MSINPELLREEAEQIRNPRDHPVDALLRESTTEVEDLLLGMLRNPVAFSGPAIARAIQQAGGPPIKAHSVQSWRAREGISKGNQ